MAAWARNIELHPSSGLSYLSRALALRTGAWMLDEPSALTIGANVAAGDVQTHDTAADCRPERHVYLVLQIRTRFRSFFRYCRPAPAPAQDVGENVPAAPPTPA